MIAADRSKYLQFVLTDPRHCGKNSFSTATDARLTLDAEIVQKEEPPAGGKERTQKQIERLPVLEMLRKYLPEYGDKLWGQLRDRFSRIDVNAITVPTKR
jgi:hypothetical protein